MRRDFHADSWWFYKFILSFCENTELATMLKPKILVVDDPEGVTVFFGEMLRDESFEVGTGLSIDQLTQKMQTLKPDLVVADIDKVSSHESFRALIKDLPIIWASRFSSLDFENLPKMARILNKPFRYVDLKLAIRSEFAKVKKRFDTI